MRGKCTRKEQEKALVLFLDPCQEERVGRILFYLWDQNEEKKAFSGPCVKIIRDILRKLLKRMGRETSCGKKVERGCRTTIFMNFFIVKKFYANY